jgi:glycerate kinase
VLFAPDSFKGTLSSVEVARALADGWKQARPDDVIGLAPLADGGDGTMEAVAAASPRGLERHRVRVSDPLGRPVDAEFLTVGDGTTALVEMAAASGLARVGGGERDALRASTDGTGDLMRAAIAGGARALVLGLGGSATTDGGSGLLRALGARLLDANGHDIAPGGAALAAIGELRLGGLPAELATVHLTVASDVRNPLLGPLGAAAVFGPQKGASPDQVVALESALTRWAAVLEGTSGRSVRDVPGTGAAGGTLAGLLAIEGRLAGLVVRPGIEVVMELTRFEDRLAACDLVVTGEGRLDAQTALGKTVWGVAQRARAAGVRIVAVVGSFGEGGRDVAAGLLARVVATSDRMADTEQAMASGAAPLRAAAARLAATIDLP